MINVIYGAKGSGKTERIIAKANETVEKSKGCVIYLTDKPEHSKALNAAIRFIDITEYDVKEEKSFVSFVKGLLAGNYDITDVFMDGPAKFTGKAVDEIEDIFTALDLIGADAKVNFTVTVSAEEVPDFMKKIHLTFQVRD